MFAARFGTLLHRSGLKKSAFQNNASEICSQRLYSCCVCVPDSPYFADLEFTKLIRRLKNCCAKCPWQTGSRRAEGLGGPLRARARAWLRRRRRADAPGFGAGASEVADPRIAALRRRRRRPGRAGGAPRGVVKE